MPEVNMLVAWFITIGILIILSITLIIGIIINHENTIVVGTFILLVGFLASAITVSEQEILKNETIIYPSSIAHGTLRIYIEFDDTLHILIKNDSLDYRNKRFILKKYINMYGRYIKSWDDISYIGDQPITIIE